MTDLEKRLLAENAELREKAAQLASALEENAALRAKISILEQTVAKLLLQIAELEEKLHQNSQNSSRPPSSDGYRKPHPKSLRKPSGKKPGGQNGHPGSSLKVERQADETVPHIPECCADCERRQECSGKMCVEETRRTVDVSFSIHVTDHQVMGITCPLSGTYCSGNFPEDIKGHIQYGENLQALVVALNTVGAVSNQRIHEIVGAVFSIPLSTGSISRMVRSCAENLSGVMEELRGKVAGAAYACFDATGIRVDKKLQWVHTASTGEYTYLYMGKRGREGMEKGGVLPYFRGTAMHDCWKPYWHYTQAVHGICCAHLLRELNAVRENHPQQTWAEKFEKLLLRMKRAKELSGQADISVMDPFFIQQYEKEYDTILAAACEENPEPETDGSGKKAKRGKVRALIDRLQNLKDCVCLFIRDFAAPFDNNQAERDLRMVKVKTKVSGCFRTEEGANAFIRIMSYVGTAKKQGVNPFHAIMEAVSGHPLASWDSHPS